MSGGIRIRPGLRKPNNPSQFRFRVRAFLIIEHVIWKFVLNGDHLPEHQQAGHSDSTFACFTIFSPANGLVVRKTGRCIAVARGFSMKRTVRPSSVTSRTDESVSRFALTYWRLCNGSGWSRVLTAGFAQFPNWVANSEHWMTGHCHFGCLTARTRGCAI